MGHSSLLFALCVWSIVSFGSARTVPIGIICLKHSHPFNCVRIIKSSQGTYAGADIGTLSLKIINFAHVNAFDTLTQIHDLVGKTTKKELKQRYQSCSMDYNDVLLCLTQAKQSYISGDFNSMKSNAAIVMKDVQDCDSKPPPDPSTLPKNNRDMEGISMIIMILADFLAGKY